MAKMLSEKQVMEYSVEYKLKVEELTKKLDIETVKIVEVLDLHSMMAYRRRQEHREGKSAPQPTRRISMTKEPKIFLILSTAKKVNNVRLESVFVNLFFYSFVMRDKVRDEIRG